MLTIIFYSSVLSICYSILIRNGELLQVFARYVNMSNYNPLIKKLLLCPHCVAGQIALWQCVYENDNYIAIPVTIIFVFYFITIMHNEKRN